ncbi:hypothetical protein [Roseisolibacter sp. H3M3-2]|uniref:hypothetical protein n=1 Tax=Roseisolibacter sp. H3M3-2 TaxID=3031323 RepID=UPI0023DB0178|nr:hypothetical protein [Roseisolibacter sp. H3M3-2]MDF1501704.1 hypothetical protein [Roseisolibacter sp. H3M3-2]
MRRAFALLLLTLLAGGCASRRLARDEARALAAADTLVLRGCLDCLTQARATYARAAAGRRGAAVAQRLFETDVLIALREKEQALGADSSMARARASAPRRACALDRARLLALAAVVMPDPDGTPLRALGEQRRRTVTMLPKLDGELAWLAGTGWAPAVRDYLRLAVDCTTGRWPKDRPLPGGPPVVRYRAAFCTRVDTVALAALQDEVPGLAEAWYYRAGAASADAADDGGGVARARFDSARARFPDAPGINFANGWLEQVSGDCDAAIARYDAAVAAQPGHERAWLQRTVCLSALHRDTAAEASATRLIALRAINSGDGYYWRALSRLRLQRLAEARGDADTAKARSRADNVLTLAGVIEHDQGDLGVAETDLRDALAGPSGAGNCTAMSYLARVLTRKSQWRPSAEHFAQAMGCFDRKVAQARERIARLAAQAAANPQRAAARIARLAADSAEQRRSYHASAYNAASMHARLGEMARAGELLEIAARDPERAEQVAKLREAIAAVRVSRAGGGP